MRVHHFYGSDLQFPHPERFVRTDGMKPELGHTGIFMLYKTIRQALAQLPARALRRIKLHVAEHAERAQVVYPSHMVVMFVGKQHGVYTTEIQRQDLLAEVRAAVQQDSAPSPPIRKSANVCHGRPYCGTPCTSNRFAALPYSSPYPKT